MRPDPWRARNGIREHDIVMPTEYGWIIGVPTEALKRRRGARNWCARVRLDASGALERRTLRAARGITYKWYVDDLEVGEFLEFGAQLGRWREKLYYRVRENIRVGIPGELIVTPCSVHHVT